MAPTTRAITPNRAAFVTTIAAALAALAIVGAALRFPGAYERSFDDATYRAIALGGAPAGVDTLRALALRVDESRAGYLQLRVAQDLGLRSYDGHRALAEARHLLIRGLTKSPGDAYAWTRLATVLALGGDARAPQALTVALMLAPHDRKLAGLQFDLGVQLWSGLSQTGREAFARRVRFIASEPELARRFAAALHVLAATHVSQKLFEMQAQSLTGK